MRSPLPLAPFEAYMLADDRASHPMTFTIRLRFCGALDRAAFQTAVSDTLRSHPLLSARVAKHGRQGLCWDWSQAAAPFVDIANESAPLRFPGSEQIELQASCGIRIWVRQGPNRCEMRLQFHHACTDGIGAYRFVEDFLCAYHNQALGAELPITTRPLDARLLEKRARFGMNCLGVMMRLPFELWGIIVGFTMFLLRRPAALHVPGELESLDPLAIPELPVRVFSEQELAVLKKTARQHRATLNDLLTSNVCQAMQEWNERHDADGRRQPIRVVVPVNLRTKALEAMPAANVVAMVFVDRKPAWYPSSQRLLKTIAWELGIIKRFRLALAFVRGTAIVHRIPGGLRFLSRANRCYATCVFSNVGVVLEKTPLPLQQGRICAGGLRLESVEYTTPVRPHTSVGLSCATYAGRMRLVLNYDRHVLSRNAAEAIFQTVLDQLGVDAAPAPAVAALAPAA